MSRRGNILLFIALLLADGLGVVLGLAIALLGRNLLPAATLPFADYWPLVIAAVPTYWLILAFNQMYDLETVLENSQEYATVATACTYGVLALVILSTFIIDTGIDRIWLLLAWLSTTFFVALARFLMRRVVRAFRRQNHLVVRALIVGADQQGRTIARQFSNVSDSGVNVVGFVDDFLPLDTEVLDGLRVLGHPGELEQIVADYRVAEIVVVQGALGWETFQELLQRSALASGPRIRLSPGFYDLLASTPRVAHRNFVPLIMLDSDRVTGFDRLLKGVLDYGIGAFALLLSLPLQLLVWLLLRLTGHGPSFDRVEVFGLGGRTFVATIFHVDPDRPLGAFFRNTGLRNLPLLFAVLSGKMSLVGPRPIPTDKRDPYRLWLPSLVTVKPGVSGTWAVVPIAGLDEEMRAALYYIRNWTIWLDLQILVQTFIVILRQRFARL